MEAHFQEVASNNSPVVTVRITHNYYAENSDFISTEMKHGNNLKVV